MGTQTLLVVGAAGNVGQGIVASALASGRNVISAEPKMEWMQKLADRHKGETLACVAGDITNEAGAEALWEEASKAFGGIDHVVVSVNVPVRTRLLQEFKAEEISRVLSGNIVSHFVAAKTFLPRLRDDGLVIGIGGGTADFIFPKMAHISMCQSAIRMLYRGLGKETKSGAQAKELMIVSMVAGENNRDTAEPDWVTDVEVGRHVCAILDAPEKFPKSVVHLRSRAQVGHPEEDS